jgi:hypothetical protein
MQRAVRALSGGRSIHVVARLATEQQRSATYRTRLPECRESDGSRHRARAVSRDGPFITIRQAALPGPLHGSSIGFEQVDP